jgi:hypothetical protein
MRSDRLGMLAFVLILLATVANAAWDARPATAVDDPAALAASAPIPAGEEGDLIRYGRDLITETPKLAAASPIKGSSPSRHRNRRIKSPERRFTPPSARPVTGLTAQVI